LLALKVIVWSRQLAAVVHGGAECGGQELVDEEVVVEVVVILELQNGGAEAR